MAYIVKEMQTDKPDHVFGKYDTRESALGSALLGAGQWRQSIRFMHDAKVTIANAANLEATVVICWIDDKFVKLYAVESE